jgi:hypothetical protein
MNELTHRQNHDITLLDPERYRLKDAALDFGIEEAKRIKDWPTLEKAVDAKIDEQRKFVAWWNGAVRSKGERGNLKSPGTRLFVEDAEDVTGMKQQRVSDLGKRLAKPDKYRERLLGAAYHAAMLEIADKLRGTQGTGENEWYTPLRFLELARLVLGNIDLDPASNPQANELVKAARIFTLDDDGLDQPWVGTVWLNPPYAQPAIADFAAKMVAEWKTGDVTAAIVLTHNYTDTAWFQQLAHAATAICFTRGRVRFVSSDGELAMPTQGQAFFYFGSELERFAGVFAEVGFVAHVIQA